MAVLKMEYVDSSNSSACSQASSNLESWIYLENNLKLDEIDNYISKILPPSVAFQTNHSTYFLFYIFLGVWNFLIVISPFLFAKFIDKV
ncbi:hypothetical protein BpHYR1_031892 [Brachionus plicatilis]|uniref:Uncharacterized protein n=1 Tax=Brachionus plicatilis TaxID=10195 RepID=A0A3M7SUM0_BRAPC|nr:hypothetical protein BpHYR1_031892 [Brachionus plicatilis]